MQLPNPVLPGFNPDPSVVRVGDTYYLVTSSFEYMPGIPVYTSTDFQSWTQIGNVITSEAQGGLAQVATNHGVWAPTIRYFHGLFYVIVTIVGGRGCVVFTATDPAGPWSEGTVIAVPGIDPDVAWDAGGVAIVTYSAYTEPMDAVPGHGGIRQVDVDLESGGLLSPHRQLWSGSGLQFPEAPHLYERDGAWYLLIAEGGTERGHGVSIARADNARGPFEPGPSNPFCSASGTNRPIQNTGHADLIELPDGQAAMLLLGVRPLGGSYGFSPLGRESFLTTLTWVNGWPVAAPVMPGADVVAQVEALDFATGLDPAWLAVRRSPEEFVDLVSAPGALVLQGDGSDLSSPRPVFLGRRQRFHYGSMWASLVADAGRGGIGVRMSEDAYFCVDAHDDGHETIVRATARIPGFEQLGEAILPSGPLELGLEFSPPDAAGPSDYISLLARGAYGGDAVELARVDGRFLSAEALGSFTGRVAGLYATEGRVRFAGLTCIKT